MLTEFRTSALPRQFNRTFTEAPDSNVVRERLARLNEAFDRLQVRGDQTYQSLQDLIHKHQVYNETTTSVRSWLHSAENELARLLQEPIAAEPLAVQQQIDKLRVRNRIP